MGIEYQNIRRGLCVLVPLMFAATGSSSVAADLWVSPNGPAQGIGTEGAPFQSLDQMMPKLAQLRGSEADVINVYLDKGTYRLSESLEFDPAVFGGDGPQINFMPFPGQGLGARPIVSGAISVSGWKKVSPSSSVYKASVSKNIASRQFYVNGQRAQRARTENPGGHLPAGFLPRPVLPTGPQLATSATGEETTEDFKVGGGIAFKKTDLNPAAWNKPCDWKNVADIEAVITTQQKKGDCPLFGPLFGPAGVLISKDQLS